MPNVYSMSGISDVRRNHAMEQVSKGPQMLKLTFGHGGSRIALMSRF
jgi:hypothetical protein